MLSEEERRTQILGLKRPATPRRAGTASGKTAARSGQPSPPIASHERLLHLYLSTVLLAYGGVSLVTTDVPGARHGLLPPDGWPSACLLTALVLSVINIGLVLAMHQGWRLAQLPYRVLIRLNQVLACFAFTAALGLDLWMTLPG